MAIRSKKKPLNSGAGSIGRALVTAICALIGMIVLGSLASTTLDGLYHFASRALTPNVPAGDSIAIPTKRPGPSSKPNAPTPVPETTGEASVAATPDVYRANPLSAVPFAFLGLLLGGFLGNRLFNSIERIGERWEKMEAGEKANIFLGVFAGLFASAGFIPVFSKLDISFWWLALVSVALVTGLSSLTIYALQSMREVLPWTQGKGPRKRSGIKLFDTNVLIDGRILDVAKAGFLDGEVYVPGFVLDELQKIADNSDPLRRARGRRGLDVLKQLQAEYPLEARVHDRFAPEQGDDVDHRLVRLAKALGADIVTNDWNLRGVAEIEEVRVMSLNELALALRPNVLPSEILHDLKIIKEGREYGQGIGYLDDGTMVVVENGGPHLNEIVDVTVTQVIQTERGKMIFAEIEGEDIPGNRVPRRGGRRA